MNDFLFQATCLHATARSVRCHCCTQGAHHPKEDGGDVPWRNVHCASERSEHVACSGKQVNSPRLRLNKEATAVSLDSPGTTPAGVAHKLYVHVNLYSNRPSALQIARYDRCIT